MRKFLEFNNGLLTGVENNELERDFKKRCTFKNGLLTNIVDTTVSTTGVRSLSFKNGLLTHVGGEVYSDPAVYLGREIEHEMSVTSFSGWKYDPPGVGGAFEPVSIDPYIVGTDIVGMVFKMKDVIYTYPDTGYPYSFSLDIIYPNDGFITHVYRNWNTSWIYMKNSGDYSWWDDSDIKTQVYALIDDIYPASPTQYTWYKNWAAEYINDVTQEFNFLIGAYCDSRNAGGTTFELTFSWMPIYYGIPPF